VEIGISRSGARETLAQGCEERPARGGGVVRGGGGWALGREQRQRAGQRKRKEKGSKQKHHACFWKENGLRKIFP
jgi:hypothetical protein